MKNQKGKKLPGNRKKQIPAILSKKSIRSSRSSRRSDDFKSRFLLSLYEKKQELENTIRFLAKGKDDRNKYSADSMIDELDRADREMAAQAHYKFVDRKKNELKRINILIDRINNDHLYGICEECGKQIPKARLLIIPEAVLCVPCQEDLENYESKTSYSGLSNSHSRYKNSLEQNDDFYNIEDAGVVVKLGSEPVSLMDMEDIDLEVLPEDDSEEDDNPTQEA